MKDKKIVMTGFLLLAIMAAFFGFKEGINFFSKAIGSCRPEENIREEVTFDSAEIIFKTDKACLVQIAYGTNNDEEKLFLLSAESEASLNHRLKLAPLLPSTQYYYQIIAGGEKTQPLRRFSTKEIFNTSPTETPVFVSPTPIPTVVVSPDAANFEKYFGSENETFDIDKNGVVNVLDWMLYQKQKTEK